jgi:hypothetical protein
VYINAFLGNTPQWQKKRLNGKNVSLFFKCFSTKITLHVNMFTYGSYDCIVSIVTRLQIGNMDFEFWQRQDMFHVLKTSRPALGSTQPPVQWVLETSSLGVR